MGYLAYEFPSYVGLWGAIVAQMVRSKKASIGLGGWVSEAWKVENGREFEKVQVVLIQLG